MVEEHEYVIVVNKGITLTNSAFDGPAHILSLQLSAFCRCSLLSLPFPGRRRELLVGCFFFPEYC